MHGSEYRSFKFHIKTHTTKIITTKVHMEWVSYVQYMLYVRVLRRY